MVKTICVFCSSSEDLDNKYYNLAKELGKLIGQTGYNLIHGAGSIGLMGVLMKSAAENGSVVTGVIPEHLNRKNIVNEDFQKLVITKDMKDRKEFMRNNSDAFIALPGGFGTVEELLEVITLKQLKYHSKPIVIINAHNYYYHLLEQFNEFYNQKFANNSYKALYNVTDDISEALNYIDSYKHENIYDKYLRE
ncbi:MAG TPA: TIGR00730 family Rossman fold protein [Bacteroidales bacterium]|nr:TIGR00730 family Rossman fold protein [Bacteroidales bacterium]